MHAQGKSVANQVIPPNPVMAWAESDQGAIARGVVDAFFEGGAALSLDGDLDVGDEVAVRLAFGRGAPTLPAAGRVVSVNEGGEQRQYSLQWTCEGSQRSAIEEQIAMLGTVH